VASASPYGITVTWSRIYGARKYGVRSRYWGLTDWEESSVLTNRIDNTYVSLLSLNSASLLDYI
jgi:hypothetical protein